MLQPNVQALLAIYKTAIQNLIQLIEPLSADELSKIRDSKTQDEDCRSIKTIIEHLIFSGYCYTNYYQVNAGYLLPRPEKRSYGESSAILANELEAMYKHCENFFIEHPDISITELDNAKKIYTRWGQLYDIDQLFEHSIVHILRHHRQISNFLKQ